MNMIITLPNDRVAEHIKNDPVRAHIPWEERVGGRQFCLALRSFPEDDIDFYKPADNCIKAIVCVSLMSSVPITEEELLQARQSVCVPTIAIYYTLWSYEKGAGTEILIKSMEYIKRHFPYTERVVTMSPLAEMATKFHLKNGAKLIAVNEETQNFEYKL